MVVEPKNGIGGSFKVQQDLPFTSRYTVKNWELKPFQFHYKIQLEVTRDSLDNNLVDLSLNVGGGACTGPAPFKG